MADYYEITSSREKLLTFRQQNGFTDIPLQCSFCLKFFQNYRALGFHLGALGPHHSSKRDRIKKVFKLTFFFVMDLTVKTVQYGGVSRYSVSPIIIIVDKGWA